MNRPVHRRLMAGLVLLFSTSVALAGPFTLSADHQLTVDWNGQPLITGDELLCVSPNAFQSPQGAATTQVNGWTVQNVWRTKDPESAVTYRREAAVNDHQVELTIQFRVPAYYQQPKGGSNYYAFSVPLKALEGATFHALVGLAYTPQDVSGKITSDMPDGSILHGTVSSGSLSAFISFEKDGRGLIFDLRPKGPSGYTDYGPTSIQGLWSIEKQGARLIFKVGRKPEFFGGVFNAKARIVEGTFGDYAKWHPHRYWHYQSELPAIGKPLTMPAGAGDKSLDVNVPQSGIYLLTVRNELAATGPFTLSCDGKVVARDVSSPAGKMQTLVFSRYTDGRQIKLRWQGKWSASTIAVQALIYKSEDVAFTRGVWLADNIPTPTNMFMFARTMPPATACVYDGQAHDHPYTAQRLADAHVPPGDVDTPSPDDPARAWRWDGGISSLGPGNLSSFYEFDTDELINRRLDDLQKLGYHTILLNGMHFRHCWPEQMPRIQKIMARTVALAHQRGMKVMDHQDVTVALYRDAGFNVLLDHLDWTQRDVRTGTPARAWCLNNPNFQKYYFKYLSDWVRNTGLDGVMLDETTFQGEAFCGCEYCREKFHHDTGLYLPYSGKDLLNFNSRLWRLWLRWRMKSVGDWYVALRRHLEQVNPHIVIMKYSTDWALLSSTWSVSYGDTLTESARAAGFLGTEIMSRNLWATYRSNLAAREAFNSMRYAFGAPIFGLVYPAGEPVFAYSGWIQNNMRAQVTWAITSYPAVEKDARRYNDWQENMDIRHAKPVADTAVLLSIPSATFPKYYTSDSYIMEGAPEQLGDQHVPYQILLNRDLTRDKLQKFKLLILPSACSMSDAEISAVHDYLIHGGKVLSLGHSAVLDELGDPRKTWPVGAWIGLKFNDRLVDTPIALSGAAIGHQPLDFPEAVMDVSRDPGSTANPDVLAQATAAGKSYIAIAQGPVGKGTLLIATPRLGAANIEKESTAGEIWDYQYNPRIGDLFARLVHRLLGDHPAFEAVNIPRAVCISVYEQPAGDGKTMTLVHLYNGTGVHMKKGEKVPEKQPDNPFPPLAEDLVFDIQLSQPGPVRAEIVSPDFAGPRQAKVESLGDHRYRVTIAKADLYAYDIVRLRD